MRRLTDWLLRRAVRDHARVQDPAVRARYGLLEGWLSVLVNLALFAAKLAAGLLVGSMTLVADAVHSLSDVLSSGVVIVGFRLAGKAPDAEHPYGHGRAESIAALIVAVLLVATAAEFARTGSQALVREELPAWRPWVLVLVGATIVIKEALAALSRELGRRIASPALAADAWHHRSDALSSVLALIALSAPQLGLPWLDGAMTLGVAAFIGGAGLQLARRVVDPMLGGAPAPALLAAIRDAAAGVPGVLGVHDLMVHDYGARTAVSLHIEVDEQSDLRAAHALAEAVELRVVEATGALSVVVHCDPVLSDTAEHRRVRAVVDDAVARAPGYSAAHDLRIVGHQARRTLLFEVVAERLDRRDRPRLRALREELERTLGMRVQIELDPHHHFTPAPPAPPPPPPGHQRREP